mmetsp:Transcript_97124/g.118948  ORF Transcript_97124/g.118948 Transcript_97124/m.118948 type:complete len:95 (-) Transcript_97124:12-296(-)
MTRTMLLGKFDEAIMSITLLLGTGLLSNRLNFKRQSSMSSTLASMWSKTAMAQRKACSDNEAASWIPFNAIFREKVMKQPSNVPAAGRRVLKSY